MTKRFKLFILTIVMALGFFLCCSLVSVSADDGSNEPAEQVNALVVGVYEYNEDGKGNAKFTLYSDYTFYAELHDLEKDETITGNGTYILDGNVLILNTGNGILKCKVNGNKLEPYAESEEIEVVEPNSFLSHLKDLKWDEFEAIIGWIIAWIVAHGLAIVGLLITLLIKRTGQIKDSRAFKEALAKMTLEQQKETQKLVNNFEKQLNNIYEENQKILNEYKQKLEELTNKQTTEIAAELSKVTEYLNEDED